MSEEDPHPRRMDPKKRMDNKRVLSHPATGIMRVQRRTPSPEKMEKNFLVLVLDNHWFSITLSMGESIR